jgi:hypothetical protein
MYSVRPCVAAGDVSLRSAAFWRFASGTQSASTFRLHSRIFDAKFLPEFVITEFGINARYFMRSKRLQEIEKKIADLKALANDEKRRLSSKERKRETRRKILFTGVVYERLKRMEKITLVCESESGKEQVTFQSIHDVERWVLQNLSRSADFSAFDVDEILDSSEDAIPEAVTPKAAPPKPKKAKATEQTPEIPVATLPIPATLGMVQGTTSFPQSSTDEEKPPNKKGAVKPANSNTPKKPQGKKKLPEVGQEEMKKQFMM